MAQQSISLLFLQAYTGPRDLHSFPTRRSSDLDQGEIVGLLGPNGAGKTTTFYMITGLIRPDGGHIALDGRDITAEPMRSEEHTSELQSRSDLVCRLLLEKKKHLTQSRPLTRLE